MRKLVALFAAFSLAAPAFAADAPAPAKPAKPKAEHKTCKRYPSSESRLGRMVCKTPAEWAGDNGEDASAPSSRTRSLSPEGH
jgi:hypothetical protein